jgi:hypothetical protein
MDQQIGPVHAPKFFNNVRWKRVVFRGVPQFGLNI